jgi:hypothetical protein
MLRTSYLVLKTENFLKSLAVSHWIKLNRLRFREYNHIQVGSKLPTPQLTCSIPISY